MTEPIRTRRPSRRRETAFRASASYSTASALLALAMVSVWLGTTSAQIPTPAGAPTAPPGLTTSAKEEPPTPAESFIDEAERRLTVLRSCSADLQEQVDLLSEHISLKGRYLKAPENRLYFQLTVAGLPDASGSSLQISDGETRWDYQAILDQQMYSKYSIKPVMERLNSPDLDLRIKEQFRDGMGFAGPETLLQGLRKTFRFEQDKIEGKLGDRSVWILRGTWKRDARQNITGPEQRLMAANGLLPPYIPMDATLYLGKDDAWPYKLELVGRPQTSLIDTRKVGPDGQRIGSRSSIEKIPQTRIVLEFTNVKLNPTLGPASFAFQAPSNASVEDLTETIVKQLDVAIARSAELKKADADRKDGPVLEKSLEIPLPSGDAAAAPPKQ